MTTFEKIKERVEGRYPSTAEEVLDLVEKYGEERYLSGYEDAERDTAEAPYRI